ncbi:uncharacterized protein BT62DRAFT_933223 [Guyanagaster necrorhizus]|uniref:Tyrosine specific protein phosphatases domain-containing protein n=1 Tax=Guyanagaster necrorhizus TaxID=856835 RepID=A0A9P8AT02_9AGAR|nr:uncharacterized protein BT62DRAFT_933223 [Guyanagaster necrorhizus MCA 3950]KAG7445387.1 hypothetical protein BT62DRAFT_933223 [Guyanagaster necrorhizus MCA 3950]
MQDVPRDPSQTAVNFLTDRGINTIISFNQYSYTSAEIALLEHAHILYRHFPVEDFQAPTIDQLTKAIDFHRFISNASTLVHCGYGHGRTGTGITALQLFATWGQSPPEADWARVNYVEQPAQVEVLKQLRSRHKGEL